MSYLKNYIAKSIILTTLLVTNANAIEWDSLDPEEVVLKEVIAVPTFFGDCSANEDYKKLKEEQSFLCASDYPGRFQEELDSLNIIDNLTLSTVELEKKLDGSYISKNINTSTIEDSQRDDGSPLCKSLKGLYEGDYAAWGWNYNIGPKRVTGFCQDSKVQAFREVDKYDYFPVDADDRYPDNQENGEYISGLSDGEENFKKLREFARIKKDNLKIIKSSTETTNFNAFDKTENVGSYENIVKENENDAPNINSESYLSETSPIGDTDKFYPVREVLTDYTNEIHPQQTYDLETSPIKDYKVKLKIDLDIIGESGVSQAIYLIETDKLKDLKSDNDFEDYIGRAYYEDNDIENDTRTKIDFEDDIVKIPVIEKIDFNEYADVKEASSIREFGNLMCVIRTGTDEIGEDEGKPPYLEDRFCIENCAAEDTSMWVLKTESELKASGYTVDQINEYKKQGLKSCMIWERDFNETTKSTITEEAYSAKNNNCSDIYVSLKEKREGQIDLFTNQDNGYYLTKDYILKYSIVKSSVNTTEIDDMIEEYENWYKPQNNNGKENVPHLIMYYDGNLEELVRKNSPLTLENNYEQIMNNIVIEDDDDKDDIICQNLNDNNCDQDDLITKVQAITNSPVFVIPVRTDDLSRAEYIKSNLLGDNENNVSDIINKHSTKLKEMFYTAIQNSRSYIQDQEQENFNNISDSEIKNLVIAKENAKKYMPFEEYKYCLMKVDKQRRQYYFDNITDNTTEGNLIFDEDDDYFSGEIYASINKEKFDIYLDENGNGIYVADDRGNTIGLNHKRITNYNDVGSKKEEYRGTLGYISQTNVSKMTFQNKYQVLELGEDWNSDRRIVFTKIDASNLNYTSEGFSIDTWGFLGGGTEMDHPLATNVSDILFTTAKSSNDNYVNDILILRNDDTTGPELVQMRFTKVDENTDLTQVGNKIKLTDLTGLDISDFSNNSDKYRIEKLSKTFHDDLTHLDGATYDETFMISDTEKGNMFILARTGVNSYTVIRTIRAGLNGLDVNGFGSSFAYYKVPNELESYLFVGAPSAGDNSEGRVYVFKFDTLLPVDTIKLEGSTGADRVGHSIAVLGNELFIAGKKDENENFMNVSVNIAVQNESNGSKLLFRPTWDNTTNTKYNIYKDFSEGGSTNPALKYESINDRLFIYESNNTVSVLEMNEELSNQRIEGGWTLVAQHNNNDNNKKLSDQDITEVSNSLDIPSSQEPIYITGSKNSEEEIFEYYKQNEINSILDNNSVYYISSNLSSLYFTEFLFINKDNYFVNYDIKQCADFGECNNYGNYYEMYKSIVEEDEAKWERQPVISNYQDYDLNNLGSIGIGTMILNLDEFESSKTLSTMSSNWDPKIIVGFEQNGNRDIEDIDQGNFLGSSKNLSMYFKSAVGGGSVAPCDFGYTSYASNGTCTKEIESCPDAGYSKIYDENQNRYRCYKDTLKTSNNDLNFKCDNGGVSNNGMPFAYVSKSSGGIKGFEMTSDGKVTYTPFKDENYITEAVIVDLNGPQYCKKDITVIPGEQGNIYKTERTIEYEISTEQLRKLSDGFNKSISLVAKDGERNSALVINSVKANYEYIKETPQIRYYTAYACKKEAIPTSSFIPRFPVFTMNPASSNYIIDRALSTSVSDQTCIIDSFKNCD